MPMNPNGGPGGPLDSSESGADNAPGQSPDMAGATPPPDGEAAHAMPAEAQPGPRRHAVTERKKQYLISPRQSMGGLEPMGFQPLQLSAIEQALRDSPDIDIIDTVGARTSVGLMGQGMGGSQGVLVAHMSEQKACTLLQQGQGRIAVERDQFLGLMEPALQPHFVSSVTPRRGPAFTAMVQVLGHDGAPVAEAEVSLFGSMLPSTAITDDNGQATLSLIGETADSIRSLYIKPKADYWSLYQRDPDISSEEPNEVTLRPLSDWPALAGFPRQKTLGWGQKAMRLDQLPEQFRGQGIKIAVIDSGVANSHETLNRVSAGFDIVNKRRDPSTWCDDELGHGTHCAGVIGAADLSFGVRGFAPDAELHACKLFPGGQVSQLIDALEYCIEKQIDVVNLSLGGAEPSEALEQQIIRARRAGVACIVAAGNSGGAVQYPASSPHVLAVAAIGKLDQFPPDSYHTQTLSQNVDANGYYSASFSCHGPQIAVCGPGVAITSTVPPNNYAAWDGTSMAAPHISGLAALVLAHHPEFQTMFKARNAERVERLFQIIRQSARQVSQGESQRIGQGLPDAVIALGLQPAMGLQASLGSLIAQMPREAGLGQLGGAPPSAPGLWPGLPFGIGMPGYGPGRWY